MEKFFVSEEKSFIGSAPGEREREGRKSFKKSVMQSILNGKDILLYSKGR